jgi:hypothetical protein
MYKRKTTRGLLRWLTGPSGSLSMQRPQSRLPVTRSAPGLGHHLAVHGGPMRY